MKFQVLSLIGHAPHPLTGELPTAADRLEQVLAVGEAAERLGFDAYALGERHAGQQIIDKILGYHEVYGHDLQSVTVDGFGQSTAEQTETLQRFAEEIAPVVRKEAPSTLWED